MRENRSLVAGSYRWGYNVAIQRQHRAFFGGDGTILYPNCVVCMYGFIHVLKCIQLYTKRKKKGQYENF